MSDTPSRAAAHLTVEELAAATGVTVRNIRAYQTANLLEPPVLQGRLALYGRRHQTRLELIRELRALGFGRADLVVAVPKSWLDVDTMADLEDVAHEVLSRTGRRMRVATKYLVQTRGFFARHGVVDYRLTESNGATEGAPAAGAAELVVDITTTGATLAANGLKILADGVILKSEAQLSASLKAGWSESQLKAAESLLRIVEARAAALTARRAEKKFSGSPSTAAAMPAASIPTTVR